MANRYNICVKRTYTDKIGNEKSSWPRIGVAFESDKGISGIIEMIPAGNWDGRFSLFAADEQKAPVKQTASDPFDDDAPF